MHPVLFQWKNIAIYSYGAMLALAFLIGISIAGRRAPSRGIEKNVIVDLALWILINSIVGARLLYIAMNWEYFQFHLWEILMVQKGGLIFYGGLIFGLLTAILFCRFKKLSFWKVADVMAPSIALGQGIGRIGCFLNGCCYGKLTDLPWGVQFPPESPASAEFGPLHLVHPAQLYSAGLDFALFFFLLWFDRRRKFDGQTFCLYVLGYAALRFGIEFLRGDNPHLFGFMTLSQMISAGLAALAFFLLWRLRRAPQSHA